MGLTVVTYGGGEILEKVFNAIAMLFNGEGQGIVWSLATVTAIYSSAWVAVKALSSQSINPFFSQYFIPVLVIYTLFFVPTTTVHIEDLLAYETSGESSAFKQKVYKVDHVPAAIAIFAEYVSSVGYHLTRAIESVMHMPNDVSYNATGMIFGADSALDTKQYQLTNPSLEQNLRKFAKQCVLYDVALGKYSVDDLTKSSDLWEFFERNTSNVRMINYCSPETKKCGYLSCKESLKQMSPYFAKEKAFYAKSNILGNLPLTFQALTGLSVAKEKLIGQQLVMNLLSNEYSGSRLASHRAHDQQQNTMQVAGSLAGSTLISMRGVLEAIIFSGFIFVMPLSLLPGGFKMIGKWASLIIWIQLWPPLYAIVNYIIQINAHEHTSAIFAGLSSDQLGLSYFSNIGLKHLQNNMIAAAGYLYTLVPMISYALLKGGEHIVSNISGSLMSPMHNAATSAATEQTSGNYSFANTSFGQTSFRNTTGFQSNLAPSLSSGYFTDHQGGSTAIYSAGENILKQNSSDLRTSLSADDLVSESLQRSEQQARSYLNSTQKTYQDSLSLQARTGSDLTTHLSNSSNYNEGISQREGHHLQESASMLQSYAANWGEQYGLNSKESLDFLCSVAAGGGAVYFSASGNASLATGVDKTEMLQSAKNVTESDSFQKSYQTVQDFAKSQNFSFLQDEGVRYAQNYSSALDQVKSSQAAHQSAESYLDQTSQNASWMRQNGHLIKQSLNQDFVNWGQKKFAKEGGFSRVEEILSHGMEKDKQTLANEFIQDLRQGQVMAYTNLWDQPPLPSVNQMNLNSSFQMDHETTSTNLQGVISCDINGEGQYLEKMHQLTKEGYQEQIQATHGEVNTIQTESENKFSEEKNKNLLKQALPNAYSYVFETPFWNRGEE